MSIVIFYFMLAHSIPEFQVLFELHQFFTAYYFSEAFRRVTLYITIDVWYGTELKVNIYLRFFSSVKYTKFLILLTIEGLSQTPFLKPQLYGTS